MNKIILIFSVSILLIGFGNTAFSQFDEKLAVLETNLGTIVIEFFPDDAPNHVDNFIGLAESEFYDGTLFHRIIPGFMIQGGDPNTKTDDKNSWGQGGPGYNIDSEFNNIKHNRGIVSMARTNDPNGAGSQFFIVNKDSNHLDEVYTVFGRLATQESFETLDKITAVETVGTTPKDPEQVKITKITIVSRTEISNLLELSEPERTESVITPFTGNQKYEDKALDIVFTAPEGWLLQQPEKTSENSPDIRIVGPIIDDFNPNITLIISNIGDKTLDDLITEKNKLLSQASNIGLKILSQEKITINEKQAYVTIATQKFEFNNKSFNVKFKEVMIVIENKSYTFAYGNIVNNFDNELSKFDESVNSFKILSQNDSIDKMFEEGGGCLIATATYGSELAPQVQQLRELRDNKLLQTELGTSFMSQFNEFYYTFSPHIADYERENPIFKEAVKTTLTPLITSLSILNHVNMDSEESVLGYGISLILLNVGMYFVAPVIIIVGIKRQLN